MSDTVDILNLIKSYCDDRDACYRCELYDICNGDKDFDMPLSEWVDLKIKEK